MTLAAGSSLDSLIYIAAAVWGIISWWRNKADSDVEPGPKQAPPPPIARRPTAPQPAQTDEERTRRFLEALGVPTAPQPRPAKPRPMPKTLIRPKPPIRPKPRPIPVQESEEIPLAGQIGRAHV